MKRNTRNSTKYAEPRLILAGFLTLGLVVLSHVTDAYGELLFFRATEDKETYVKNRSIYEIVVLPPGSGMDTVYVERTPALRVQAKEIESVLIEKKPMYKDTQTAVQEALGLRSGKREKDKEEGIAGYYYTATFSLSNRGSEQFTAFGKKHDGELVDLKIKTQRVAVLKLRGPFGSNVISTMLRENDPNRLKEIFSPIKDKVIWK